MLQVTYRYLPTNVERCIEHCTGIIDIGPFERKWLTLKHLMLQ
jgi:hypothetical protein